MHTGSARGTRDVETIVDEQSRRAALQNRRRTCREFVKHARAQRFFPYLDERNSGCDSSFDQSQYF